MSKNMMKKQNFARRVVQPIILVTGIMLLSMLVYDLSGTIKSRILHDATSTISALFLFLSIWLGGLIANTIAFFRGATFKERIGICLVAPLIWSFMVMSQLYGIYSMGEFFFFLLHPLILGCPVAGLLCLSISELWCRKIHNYKYPRTALKVFQFGNVSLLILSFSLTFLFLWEAGHFYVYNIYMRIHAQLFI